MIVTVISIAFLVLELLTAWKVFVKYGEPGWKGLIPFYSDYVEYGKVWTTTMGIIYVVLVILYGVCSGSEKFGGFAGWFNLAYFIINIIFSNKKSKAFGKGIGMTLVLIFFPFIGNLVLGFGDARYQGAQG